MTKEQATPEQNKILQLYGVFGAALVFSVIPTLTASLVTLILFVAVLIAAYVIRGGAEEGSLTENHTTFIIRTIWIVGLFAILTVTAGSVYMLGTMDKLPLMPCARQLLALGPQADGKTFIALLQPCVDEFVAVNKTTLIYSMIIVAGPVLLYLAVRYIRGVSRAIKGYRLANVKAWF